MRPSPPPSVRTILQREQTVKPAAHLRLAVSATHRHCSGSERGLASNSERSRMSFSLQLLWSRFITAWASWGAQTGSSLHTTDMSPGYTREYIQEALDLVDYRGSDGSSYQPQGEARRSLDRAIREAGLGEFVRLTTIAKTAHCRKTAPTPGVRTLAPAPTEQVLQSSPEWGGFMILLAGFSLNNW